MAREKSFFVKCKECGFAEEVVSTEEKKSDDAGRKHHEKSPGCGNLSLEITSKTINPEKGTAWGEMPDISNVHMAN